MPAPLPTPELHHSLSEEFEGKRMIGRPLPQPARRRFPLAARRLGASPEATIAVRSIDVRLAE